MASLPREGRSVGGHPAAPRTSGWGFPPLRRRGPMITTAGRGDLAAFWDKSGILEYKTYTHYPILAFVAGEEGIVVRIIERPEQMESLPPETKCMAQWPGKWRSDFFQFTAQ